MHLQDGKDLNKIVLQAPIGICILNAHDLVAEIVNDKFLEVAGKPYEEIYGRYYWDAFAEARAGYEAALAGVVNTGETFYADEVELMLIRHGKEDVIFVTFVYAPITDEAGLITKIAVWVLENTKEVTQRQTLEVSKSAFENERNRLRRFLMQLPAGICILEGPELRYALVNARYQEMLPGRNLMGRPIFEALPEIVGTALEGILLNVYKTGVSYVVNELLVPIAKEEEGPTFDRHFNLNYQARLNEKDEVDGIIIFAYDITEAIATRQALIEEKLQTGQQQRLYEAITSGTPDLMYVFRLDYRFTYVNDALLSMWGKTWDNAVGKSLLENGYEPWHAEMHEREIDHIKATREVVRGEVSFPHASLGKRVYDYILTPVVNEANEVEAVAGVTRDVTERKLLEDSLAQASEELQAVNEELAATNEELAASNEELLAGNEELADLNEKLNNAQVLIEESEIALRLAIDAADFGTWRIHSVTREFITDARLKELFGYYPDESLSIEQALSQITDDYRQYVATKLENAIYSGGDYDVTYPVVGLHDHKLRWLRAIGNLKADASGEFSSFTGVVMDVTEQQLHDQRKNDFIGMVSHELKTPITSLYGYLQLINDNGGMRDEVLMNHAMDKSMKQVQKMTKMINSFLNIARLESGMIHLEKKSFFIGELMQELEEEWKLTLATHSIIFEPVPVVEIVADKEKIAQVMNNLISNSAKYSESGTLIVIKATVSAEMLTIAVSDSGVGISEADLPNIFQRFYRADTSNLVAGFGIGLYLCAEIIRLHDGTLSAKSKKGEGSQFYFSLPI